MTKTLTAVLSGVFGIAIATGCSGSSDPTTNTGSQPAESPLPANCKGASVYSAGMEAKGTNGVTVKILDSTPAPPGVGNNDLVVAVSGPDGKPLAGANLKFFLWMPAHGHPGARDPVITDNGDGTYDAKFVDFNMDGLWTVTIQVTTADNSINDKPMFTLCAQ